MSYAVLLPESKFYCLYGIILVLGDVVFGIYAKHSAHGVLIPSEEAVRSRSRRAQRSFRQHLPSFVQERRIPGRIILFANTAEIVDMGEKYLLVCGEGNAVKASHGLKYHAVVFKLGSDVLALEVDIIGEDDKGIVGNRL